jgi:hypothetical protein
MQPWKENARNQERIPPCVLGDMPSLVGDMNMHGIVIVSLHVIMLVTWIFPQYRNSIKKFSQKWIFFYRVGQKESSSCMQ